MVMPRKAQHIDICLNEQVDSDFDYWQDITFVHNALPEIDMDDIVTSIELFGKKLEAPIVIAAITGGFAWSRPYGTSWMTRSSATSPAAPHLIHRIHLPMPVTIRPRLAAQHAAARITIR